MLPRTIRAYLDHHAESQPDAVYLVAPETGRELRYCKLREHARALHNKLTLLGAAPGDTVSLMMHNGYATATLLLGIMDAGRVVAPINLLSQPSQLAYVLEHSDTRAVFVAPEYRDRLDTALRGLARKVAVVMVDVDSPDSFLEAGAASSDLPEVGEEDDALLMYTSGTTGAPKGVVLTHKNVVAGGLFTAEAHALTAADRVLCALPLYHINGQIVTTVAPLVSGGSVVMPHRFSASNYWETVVTHRCTWINVVPTIISYLLNGRDPRASGLSLERVRFGRSASAPLPPELHRAFEEKFGVSVIETFGMTETAAPCFTNPLDPAKRKYGSPGQAFGNEAKVIDPATGQDLPAGVPGELMVRGDNVMKHYRKAPEITAKTLKPDGWLHTGDLGYRDEDGFYFVTGRLKELIIKGGENIAPREIDEALLKHPAVLEAAAVGIPDPHYGQEIMACVILKPDCACTVAELRAFAECELGRYKTPKVLRLVIELPKGPSGKVQRLKLAEGYTPG